MDPEQDPIEAMLSEETEEGQQQENQESTGTSGQESKTVEVDGEPLSSEEIAEIVRAKRELEKRNRQLEKDYKNIQKLASRKGIPTERQADKQEEEQEEDEFKDFDPDKDRKYLKKKIGVLTEEDRESLKEELRREMKEELEVRQSAASIEVQVRQIAKQYDFVNEADLVDYMGYQAKVKGRYVTPEEALQKLYPGQVKSSPKPNPLPQPDSSEKGDIEAPARKVITFDDRRGMEAALMEELFAGGE